MASSTIDRTTRRRILSDRTTEVRNGERENIRLGGKSAVCLIERVNNDGLGMRQFSWEVRSNAGAARHLKFGRGLGAGGWWPGRVGS